MFSGEHDYAEGEAEKTYTDSTTPKIKGSEVTRHGSKDNKAIYIKREDEGGVLKSESGEKRYYVNKKEQKPIRNDPF